MEALYIGIGATAVMDAWMLVRRRLFGIPTPDYGLVGRWIAYMPRGRFRHEPITGSAPVRGERAIGWLAHYLTGIAFAALLLAAFGRAWVRDPTVGAALAVGLATVVAPFFLMQPGMGAGIAASRAPRPWSARIQGLVTHVIFGLGLYLAAEAARVVA